MARIAITIDDDLVRLARQASAKLEVSLSATAAVAFRELVAKADLKPTKIDWPEPVEGTRALTPKEICDAINEGRE